jgi:tripartite-type tricarboxylate transporter receptor subunit TctC
MKTKEWVSAGFCSLFLGLFMVGSLMTAVHSVQAAGTGYPEKPINLVVPLAAGGQTDLNARALAEAMEKELKQPVVVVNKPGGTMTVGGYAVASAKPDGYTLGFFPPSASLPEVFSYFYSAPYSSEDLRPVCRVATPVLVIAVKGDAPWSSLKELIEHARKNPRMKFGDTGKSGTGYSVMSTIARAEKVDLVEVPFDGDGTTVAALLGGHISIGLPAFPVTRSLTAARKLKILALCIDKKAPFAPDIPTVVELGYKLPYVPYIALFAPRKTPDEVIEKLDELVRKISADKNFQNKYREMDSLLFYEGASSFEKTLARYKAQMSAFFKEEGLTK